MDRPGLVLGPVAVSRPFRNTTEASASPTLASFCSHLTNESGPSPTLAAGPMSAWQARLGGRFAGGSIAADLPIALPARTISSRSRDSARHLMPPIGLSRSFSQVSPGELARSKLTPAWSRFFASVGHGRRLSFAEVHRLRSTPYADSEKMQEPSTSDLWAGLCASHSIHRV